MFSVPPKYAVPHPYRSLSDQVLIGNGPKLPVGFASACRAKGLSTIYSSSTSSNCAGFSLFLSLSSRSARREPTVTGVAGEEVNEAAALGAGRGVAKFEVGAVSTADGGGAVDKVSSGEAAEELPPKPNQDFPSICYKR